MTYLRLQQAIYSFLCDISYCQKKKKEAFCDASYSVMRRLQGTDSVWWRRETFPSSVWKVQIQRRAGTFNYDDSNTYFKIDPDRIDVRKGSLTSPAAQKQFSALHVL